MDINKLEEWFKNASAPQMPVYLNEATKVNDYKLFVDSHFEGIKAAPTDFTKAPLLDRLLKMKILIEANQ
jgi:hypothetical protein